jgi:hypothetical protein
VTGYLHGDYAAALVHVGEPRALPRSGGWLLERTITGTAWRDGVGCYPLFACADWTELHADLDQIDALVSVTAVTDPFGDYDEMLLCAAFRDVVRPYKRHYVIDLARDPGTFVSEHHRRNARRALDQLDVEICDEPLLWLDEWVRLYDRLVQRHDIAGAAAFPRASFARQFEVPGLTLLRAVHEDTTVGMVMWFTQQQRVYYHLAAYDDAGYTNGASFALFWRALEHFAQSGAEWIGLGAGAGVHDDGADGLTRFKRGWATDTRVSWLCGRIIDRQRYEALARNVVADDAFFPRYRAPAAHPVNVHAASKL